jgi:hypothetical protein
VVVVAATAAVLLGFAVTVHLIADARWNAMQNWTRDACAAYQRRDFRRPVAWGESQPGNSFAHYRRALALALPLVDVDRLSQLWGQFMLRKPRAGTEPMTAEQAAAIRAAWAPAIAEARAGARCAEAGPAVDFHQRDSDFNLLTSRWLVNMMMLEARDALAQRDAPRAVEVWLDALAFGTDLMRSPSMIDRMIGGSVGCIVVMNGCTEESLQALDRAQLERLAAGLARIDEPALATSSLADEAMMSAHYTLQHTEELAESAPATWRFGWSMRWMMADALLQLIREAEQPAVAGQPWPVRRDQLEAQQQQAMGAQIEELLDELRGTSPEATPAAAPRAATAGDRNPWLFTVWPILTHSEGSARGLLAQLRCLRVAVEHHRGAELPALPDPLGDGPLVIEPTAGGLRIASVGEPNSSWRVERIAALR